MKWPYKWIKKVIEWETLYGLRDRSHGLRNGFCSNCTEICAPEVCPIWQSLEDAPLTRAEIEEAMNEELDVLDEMSDEFDIERYHQMKEEYLEMKKAKKEPDNEDG